MDAVAGHQRRRRDGRRAFPGGARLRTPARCNSGRARWLRWGSARRQSFAAGARRGAGPAHQPGRNSDDSLAAASNSRALAAPASASTGAVPNVAIGSMLARPRRGSTMGACRLCGHPVVLLPSLGVSRHPPFLHPTEVCGLESIWTSRPRCRRIPQRRTRGARSQVAPIGRGRAPGACGGVCSFRFNPLRSGGRYFILICSFSNLMSTRDALNCTDVARFT
jgi:hypothetical protein